MAYEHKNGTGTIFQNKKNSEMQPDFKGELKTNNGELIKFAGWWKESKAGTRYIACKQEEAKTNVTNSLPF